MSLYDAVFLVQLIATFVIIMFSIYRLMSPDKESDFRTTIVLFVGYLFCLGFGFIVVIEETSKQIYSTIFLFQAWLVILIIITTIVDLFKILKGVVSNQSIYKQESYERR